MTSSRTAPRPARWTLSYVLLAAAGLIVGALTMDFHAVGSAGDDAMYVMLARSLATGAGYVSQNLPGAPANTHFPPGYPAVLSALWRIAPEFPANLLLFRVLNVLCLGAIAVGVARMVHLRTGMRNAAVVTGAITLLSVPLLVIGAMLLSEPLFLALLLLVLPTLESLAEKEAAAPRSAMLGVAIGLCTLVRSHGIVLLPALLVALGARRRWRTSVWAMCGALLILVPWQLWLARHAALLPAPLRGGYGSYAAWWLQGLRELGWSMIPRTVARTSSDITGLFGALLSPVRGTVAHSIAALAFLVVAAAAAAVSWRRIPVTLLFLAGYLALVIVWPFHPARFVWGIWPLFVMVAVLGVRAALPLGEPPAWRAPVRALVLLSGTWIGIGYAAYEIRALRGRWWSSIPRAESGHIAMAVGWTKANTAPADVVATEDEAAVFLYTGRRTVPVRALSPSQYLDPARPDSLAATGLLPVLAAYPVRAVIVYSRTAQDIAQFLSSPANPRLAPAGTFPDGAAYYVQPR